MESADVERRKFERFDFPGFYLCIGVPDLIGRNSDVPERQLCLIELLGVLEDGRIPFLSNAVYNRLYGDGNFFRCRFAAVDDAFDFGYDVFLP